MAAVNVEKLPAMFLMFKAREDMEIQQPSQPQERGEVSNDLLNFVHTSRLPINEPLSWLFPHDSAQMVKGVLDNARVHEKRNICGCSVTHWVHVSTPEMLTWVKWI